MSEFKVPVVRLVIEDHPNADALELAVVGGYRSVVRKGQFKTGDLAVYIPEQAVLPQWLVKELGLEGRLAGKNSDRVKAQKIRGILSQGLVYQLCGRDGLHFWDVDRGWCICQVDEGDDVKDLLGIVKWEPPIPVHMAGQVWNAMGRTVKYDIENWKNYPNVIQEGEHVVFTEKAHGCAEFNTLIETLEYGLVTIGYLVQNELKCHVKSFNIQTREVEYNEVIGYSEEQNNNDWYTLETEDGESITLTGNHLVWVDDLSCYRAVRELTGNETLLLS